MEPNWGRTSNLVGTETSGFEFVRDLFDARFNGLNNVFGVLFNPA